MAMTLMREKEIIKCDHDSTMSGNEILQGNVEKKDKYVQDEPEKT